MVDLQKLRTFRRVAELGNFTRAAAQLGCGQSNVSTQIKALELQFGGPLFERKRFSKTIVLTDLGELVLDYAGRLLELANEAQTAITAAKRAQVSRDLIE